MEGPSAGLCHGKKIEEAVETVLGLAGIVDDMFSDGVVINGWQCCRMKAPSN